MTMTTTAPCTSFKAATGIIPAVAGAVRPSVSQSHLTTAFLPGGDGHVKSNLERHCEMKEIALPPSASLAPPEQLRLFMAAMNHHALGQLTISSPQRRTEGGGTGTDICASRIVAFAHNRENVHRRGVVSNFSRNRAHSAYARERRASGAKADGAIETPSATSPPKLFLGAKSDQRRQLVLRRHVP